MKAVRGPRPLAMALAGALAILGGVLGVAMPASATGGMIDGHVSDLLGPIAGVTVLVIDENDVQSTATTDGTGYYSIPPTAGDGQYFVTAGSDDYVWADPQLIDVDASLGTTDFVLDPGAAITGTIRDRATGLPMAGAIAFATGQAGAGIYFDYHSPTDATGAYRITVPLGDAYQVAAADVANEYDIQYWDHHSFSSSACGCATDDLITVPSTFPQTPVTGIDFDLMRLDEWIYFSALTLDTAGASTLSGVKVYLDLKVGSAWVQKDVQTTDSGGYADLYGFGPGDYRLRAKIAGTTAIIAAFDDYGAGAALSGNGKALEFPPLAPSCGCAGLEEIDADLSLKAVASTPKPPAPRPPAATPPVIPPTLTTGSTPQPSATPTPTPTPTSSATTEPQPSPSVTETPAPQPAATSGDLWWVWLLIALLAIGIAVTIVALVRRR